MDVIIRQFSQLMSYYPVWKAMREFTSQRESTTVDEIWMLEHPPTFTQGLAGKPEHVLNIHEIPLIQCDRGGQVTYHGPGQLMVYLLLDLDRLKLKTRSFIRTIENSVIDFLKNLGVNAQGKEEAPGVYVGEAKICSIGLRVRKGWSYHGLACNVAMDLTPFTYINPCGFTELSMTQICDYVSNIDLPMVRQAIIPPLLKNFGYNQPLITIETTLESCIDIKV